jgi:predicted esterase
MTQDVAALESLTLAGVPLVLRHPAKRDEPAPLIVLWHGFGSPNSERTLAEVLPLDDVHAWKAYLGLPLFGARLPEGGIEEIRRRQQEDYALELFLPVAAGAREELPGVVRSLARDYAIELEGGIGIFGFSAGGAAAMLNLIESPIAIRTAILCNTARNMASAVSTVEKVLGKTYAWPEAAQIAAERIDPIARAGEIARREPPASVLLLYSENDEYFAAEHASDLAAALQAAYRQAGNPRRVTAQMLGGMTHHFGPSAGQHGPVRISEATALRRAVGEWLQAEMQE